MEAVYLSDWKSIGSEDGTVVISTHGGNVIDLSVNPTETDNLKNEIFWVKTSLLGEILSIKTEVLELREMIHDFMRLFKLSQGEPVTPGSGSV